jgi:hypothetical protein
MGRFTLPIGILAATVAACGAGVSPAPTPVPPTPAPPRTG